MSIITQRRIRHLPVVEDGKVLGVVSSGDLTHHLLRTGPYCLPHRLGPSKQNKYLTDIISLYDIAGNNRHLANVREITNNEKICITSAIVVLAVLLGLSSSLVQGASPTDPIQENEKDALFPSTSMIDYGREVAETACADCHGMDGISDSQGQPHLAGQRAIYLYRVQQAYQSGHATMRTKTTRPF